MSYFKRYSQGDYLSVWTDLVSLGPSVRNSDVLEDAYAVALATMERVATNIDTIVCRLREHGYDFARYPDGSPIPFAFGPVVLPTDESLRKITNLESLIGHIPLSLKAFWERVGAVSLIGFSPSGWPEYSDPLVVEPPEVSVSEYQDWLEDEQDFGRDNVEPFVAPISPDVFHKDNFSGGPPYGFRLPSALADEELRNEPHHMPFVQYLRFSLLEWGGFPGLSPVNLRTLEVSSQQAGKFAWIGELKNGLVPF